MFLEYPLSGRPSILVHSVSPLIHTQKQPTVMQSSLDVTTECTLQRNSTPFVYRSKSAGHVYALLHPSKMTNFTKTTFEQQSNSCATFKQCTRMPRSTSISPTDARRCRTNTTTSVCSVASRARSSDSPIAFGRSISKERTFAEERKRLQQSNSVFSRIPCSVVKVKSSDKTTTCKPSVKLVTTQHVQDRSSRSITPLNDGNRTMDKLYLRSSRQHENTRTTSTLRGELQDNPKIVFKKKQTRSNTTFYDHNNKIVHGEDVAKSQPIVHHISKHASRRDKSRVMLNGKQRQRVRSKYPPNDSSNKIIQCTKSPKIPVRPLRPVNAVRQSVETWNTILNPSCLDVNSLESSQDYFHYKSTFPKYRRPLNALRHHLDKFEHRIRQSRSLSPMQCLQRKHPINHIHYPNTALMACHKHQQKICSRSSPDSGRNNVCLTEVVQPDEPLVIHGRTLGSSCREIRSSSCIPFLRNQYSALDERRYNSLDTSCRAVRYAESFNTGIRLTQRPSPSERFRDLNRFYTDLERMGELEKSTSTTDFRPIRPRGTVINFDEWYRQHQHERAEKELNQLRGRLRLAELEKDLVFRAHNTEVNKWNSQTDSGLRCKEKSVENLKDILCKNNAQFHREVDRKVMKSPAAITFADQHKLLGPNSSAQEVSIDIAKVTNTSNSSRSMGISKRLIGTLSVDQVSRIETQLSEIYKEKEPSSNIKNLESQSNAIRESEPSKEPPNRPYIEQHECRIVKAPLPEIAKNARVSRSVDRIEFQNRNTEQRDMSESEKRSIMHKLSQEIRDKVSCQKSESSGQKSESTPSTSEPKKAKDAPNLIDQSSNLMKVDQNRSTYKPRKVDDVIEFFECKRDEPPPEPIVHRASEYFSTDDEDVSRLVVKPEMRRNETRINSLRDTKDRVTNKLGTSLVSLNEIFGECRKPIQPPRIHDRPHNTNSVERIYRSRSVSPIIHSNRSGTTSPFEMPRNATTLSKYFTSNPELHVPIKSKDSRMTTVRRYGANVPWIAHMLESQYHSSRCSRSRRPHPRSPVQKLVYRNLSDRLMPRIDIISKTLQLTGERSKSLPPLPVSVAGVCPGDVRRIRNKFESIAARQHSPLFAQMFTSSPNVSERKIYLSGHWTAHKYPHCRDNLLSEPNCELVHSRRLPQNRTCKLPTTTDQRKAATLLNMSTKEASAGKQTNHRDKRLWRKLSVKFQGDRDVF